MVHSCLNREPSLQKIENQYQFDIYNSIGFEFDHDLRTV